MVAYYSNVTEIARRIGWVYLDEYCIGNRNAPFVRHEEKKGVFVFVDALPAGVKVEDDQA